MLVPMKSTPNRDVSLDALVAEMREARRIVALTGAGMSTESGLPDFRSAGGLWRQHRPEQLASVTALRNNPADFYDFYRWRLGLLAAAQPNDGHRALANLQRRGRLGLIVTQNVDGLHHAAGSEDVAEVHGTLRTAHCNDCGTTWPADVLHNPVPAEDSWLRCDCGGIIRPGVVLFGEGLPTEPFTRAVAAVEACDGLLVVGSSLAVHPVASLPELALARKARLWIVNLGPTPYDDVADAIVRAPAAEVLTALAEALA